MLGAEVSIVGMLAQEVSHCDMFLFICPATGACTSEMLAGR